MELNLTFSGTVLRSTLTAIAASILINGVWVLGHFLAVAKIGTNFLLAMATFAIFPLMLTFLAMPLLLIRALWKSHRKRSLRQLIFCVIYLAIGIGCFQLGFQIRRAGFINLAERSRPLILAIHRFEAKYGKPPENLEQITPEFLPQVPKTGMGAYPEYEYQRVNDRNSYEGNAWVVTVSASSGLVNWDQFLYFPKQNYPKSGYGGGIERIEEWAYVHE
ncbi:MAG: hypothetical protein ND895_28910 [Pyrinomonadaceae bacterium]|nr:hypothetical protein [Pyrinomonadaceae bacterium]